MITSGMCDEDDANNGLLIIHFTLSTYNVVNSVSYFALIFKLVETRGRGGSIFSYKHMAWTILGGAEKWIFGGGI